MENNMLLSALIFSTWKTAVIDRQMLLLKNRFWFFSALCLCLEILSCNVVLTGLEIYYGRWIQ